MSAFAKPGNILAAVVIAAALFGGFLFGSWFSNKGGAPSGAISGPNIENYVPAIQYNRGYKSAFPIYTTGSTTVGSLLDVSGVSTFAENINIRFATSSSSGVASLAIGTSTPQSNAQIVATSNGTTTLSLTSTKGATSQKIGAGCIQLLGGTSITGTAATTSYRMYVTSTTTARSPYLHVEPGTCQDGPQ